MSMFCVNRAHTLCVVCVLCVQSVALSLSLSSSESHLWPLPPVCRLCSTLSHLFWLLLKTRRSMSGSPQLCAAQLYLNPCYLSVPALEKRAHTDTCVRHNTHTHTRAAKTRERVLPGIMRSTSWYVRVRAAARSERRRPSGSACHMPSSSTTGSVSGGTMPPTDHPPRTAGEGVARSELVMRQRLLGQARLPACAQRRAFYSQAAHAARLEPGSNSREATASTRWTTVSTGTTRARRIDR